MRSRYADRPETIVPRTLRHLLAEDEPRGKDAARRRRTRRTMTVRRVT